MTENDRLVVERLRDSDNPQVGGVKYDADKPRFDLLHPQFLLALARLGGKGAAKYGERNWEKGMSWGRLIGAAGRHLTTFMDGELYDRDTRELHVTALGYNSMMLYAYITEGLGEDDRRKQ